MKENKIQNPNEKNSKAKKKNSEMSKSTSWVFRIAGIIFFVANLIMIVEMLQVNITTFMFIADAENSSRIWNIFFILMAILYTISFLTSIIATSTAAIFGGKNNYTQSVWNFQIVAIITLAIYSTIQIITRDSASQEESESIFIMATTLIMEIFFAIIAFFCLKELPEFNWRNIFSKDANSKLCRKVCIVMLVLIEVGCFIYANKILNQ